MSPDTTTVAPPVPAATDPVHAARVRTRAAPGSCPHGPRGSGIRRISAVYLWIAVHGAVRRSSRRTRSSPSTTFKLVFSEGVVTCVLALAFLVPLAAGQYDLAIGAVMSLRARDLASTCSCTPACPPALGALIAVAACALVRRRSPGFIVVRLQRELVHRDARRQPGAARRGAADLGQPAARRRVPGLVVEASATTRSLGIPIVVFYLLAISLVLWYVLRAHPHRPLPLRDRRQLRGRAPVRRAHRPDDLGLAHRLRARSRASPASSTR